MTETIHPEELLHHEVVRSELHQEWMILVHGAGGSIKTWKYQVEALAQHFNLVLIDLRDHGRSKDCKPHRDRYDFQLISEDIRKVMDHLNIDRAHFLTLSFGSVLIQDFSLRFGERVNRIVMAGGIFKANWRIRIFVSCARVLNLILPYHLMYRLFSYLLMPRKNHQKARRMYQLQARKLSTDEYMKWLSLYGEFFKLLRRFFREKIARPTLVIMGAEDYVFYRSARQFAYHQPQAHWQSIEGAGHICNIEKPVDFNKLVLQFLGATSPVN